MKRIIIALFTLLPFIALSQTDGTINKGSGIFYFSGKPVFDPSGFADYGEFAIDVNTKKAYVYSGAGTVWNQLMTVDTITTLADTTSLDRQVGKLAFVTSIGQYYNIDKDSNFQPLGGVYVKPDGTPIVAGDTLPTVSDIIIAVDSIQQIPSLNVNLGDRIKVKSTGAEYLVQADSIENLTIDGLFQIKNGSNTVVYSPDNCIVNPDDVGISENLADSIKWKRLFDYVAKTGCSIYIPGGKVYQIRPFSHDFGTTPINITGPKNNRSVFTTQKYGSIRFTERVDLTKPLPKSYLNYDTLFFIADVVPVRDSAISTVWEDIASTVELEDYIMYENGNTSIVTRDQAVASGFVAELDVDLPEPTEDGLYVVANPGCTWGGGVAWCDFDFQAGLKVMMGTLVELKNGTWSNVNPSYWLSTESDINIENVIFEDFSISVVLPKRNYDITNKVMNVDNVEARHIQRFCALETAGVSSSGNGAHFFPARAYEVNTASPNPIVYSFRGYTFEKLNISNSLFDNVFFGVVQGFPMTKDYRVINNICQNSPNVLGFFTSNYMIPYIDETNSLIAYNKFYNNRHYHRNADNRRLAGAHGPNAVFKSNIFWQNTGQHMRGNYRNGTFINNVVDVFNYDTASTFSTTIIVTKIASHPIGGNNFHIVKGNKMRGGIAIRPYVYQGEGDVFFEDNEIDVSINKTRIFSDTSKALDRQLVYIAQSKNRFFELDPYAHIDTASFELGDYVFFDYRKQSWTKLRNIPSSEGIIFIGTSTKTHGNVFFNGGRYTCDALIDTRSNFLAYEYESLIDITIDNAYFNFNTFNDPLVGWSNLENVTIRESNIVSGGIPSNTDELSNDADNILKGKFTFKNNTIEQRRKTDVFSRIGAEISGNDFSASPEAIFDYFIKTDAKISNVTSNIFRNNGNCKYSIYVLDSAAIVGNIFKHQFEVDTVSTSGGSFIKAENATVNVSSNKIDLFRPYSVEISNDYQNYINTVQSMNGVAPALSEQYRVSYYLEQIKDSVGFDILYNYGSSGDSIAKLTSLGAFSEKANSYGDIVFNANTVSATDTAWIETGYVPSVDGINWERESAHIAVGFNPRKASSDNIHGTQRLSVAGRSVSWNRANTSISTTTISSTLDPFFIQTNTRNSDTSQQVWYNQSLINETIAPSQIINDEVWSYSYNASTKRYSKDKLAFFSVGSGVPKTYINNFYNAIKGVFYESIYLVEVDSLSTISLVNNEQSSKIGPDMLIIATEGQSIDESAIYESGNRFPNSYFSYNDRWKHLEKENNIDTLQTQNPKTSSTIQTSDFTAEIGVTYQVDCSSGPITITPPSSPPVNGSFRVIDVTSNAGSNNITLGFQGSGINVYSQDTDYIINYDAADISFTYHGVTTGFTAKQ